MFPATVFHRGSGVITKFGGGGGGAAWRGGLGAAALTVILAIARAAVILAGAVGGSPDGLVSGGRGLVLVGQGRLAPYKQ